MATSNQSVTADHLISATVKYSNKDDASRVYDISANAHIENGRVGSFESGEVRMASAPSDEPDGMEGMNTAATFNAYGEKNLNLYVSDADESEASAILAAIYAFMTDVRASVSDKPIQA